MSFDLGEVDGVATFMDDAIKKDSPDVAAGLHAPGPAEVALAVITLEVAN